MAQSREVAPAAAARPRTDLRRARGPAFMAYKWAVGLLMGAVCMTVYNVIGRLDLPRSTTLLDTPLDHAIPFLTWTSWLYEPLYVAIFALAATGFSSRLLFQRAIACVAANQVVASLCHYFIRATYPRPLLRPPYPDVSTAFMAFVQRIDPPANVFPSLHVAQTFVISFLLLRDRQRVGAFSLLLCVLLAISTVTTKQHFVVDVAAGLAMAVVGRAIALRGISADAAAR